MITSLSFVCESLLLYVQSFPLQRAERGLADLLFVLLSFLYIVVSHSVTGYISTVLFYLDFSPYFDFVGILGGKGPRTSVLTKAVGDTLFHRKKQPIK